MIREAYEMLYFDEYGNKDHPVILMLHGAGALDTFSHQYCFAEKYRLIVPHLPGAGKAAGQIYDPQKTKNDIIELMDHIGQKPIGIIGHSLGGQLAVMLVCERPEWFRFAIFLSAWVDPEPSAIQFYCRLAEISAAMLHWPWLMRLQGKYWNFTPEQTDYMAEYSKHITPEIYRSFFAHTLELGKLPSYPSVHIPMTAICGSKETKGIRSSLDLLAKNPYCQAITLPNANHDFPMRNPEALNRILAKIFSQYIKDA